MDQRVALLLDQERNPYQELLAAEARARAPRRSLRLVSGTYANGSAVAQMEQLMACARGSQAVEGVILVPAGGESQMPACRHLVKAGVSVVFLNRVPEYLGELRAANPDVLVAAVTPDQQEIGRIQAEQLARLGPGDRLVLLVTGAATSESATRRRRGFLDALPPGADPHVLEADWSEESGARALTDFFRLGAHRGRPLAAVVCQNDPMAVGVRRVLEERARETGEAELSRVPVLGCDGLPDEGQRLVASGALAGTVVMPPTSGRAVDLLAAFWESGSRADVIRLAPDSFPPLSEFQSA